MTYTVYTFGGGEILNGVFNAIAMSLNGKAGMLEPLKRLGLIFGAFWAVIYAVYGDQIKVLTHWLVPMTIFMNLLFVPRATVWIIDPVHHYKQNVDNVPYGLAALAGYVSTIGYQITSKVESIFTLPDDLRYQKSGFLFASDIIQKAKTFHITNADLAENMRSFVSQCVLYDAMLGRKYNIDELRNADDIWGLVSANPSQARSFVWRDLKVPDQPRNRPNVISCSEGVGKINELWTNEINNTANLFGRKIFDKAGVINPRAELIKYLPMAYKQLGDISKEASEIIQQQMMIYSIVDGVESNSTALGNAPNFAARRAYLQQRSTYETLGAMAGETLPVMKAVLEAIIYAFFLFVIPLAMLPFGYRFLLTWAQSILWLQLWAPLYAILNYIMTIAATSKTMAALAISNSKGVTIASSVGLANVNADISAMAGYLAMSIPFLSIALVKGVGSFVHMASHLGNVAQSAAGMAANEVTSGNLSYGNFSEGNSQISNSSMLSHSMAASYKGSSAHIQDGRSEITTMGDGSQVMNVGSSNLPVSLNVAESQSAQLSQMASQSQQNALNHSESSASSLSSSYRDMVDLSKTLSQSNNSSDSVRQGVSTEQSQAVSNGAQIISDFAHQNNTQDQKAADFLAEASIGFGLGKNSASSSFKNNLSASDQELYQKAEKLVQDQNVQDTMRQATNASKDISHTASDENTKRLATGISGSYEQSMSQRNEASKSFRQAEDYSNQANFTKANSATINANHNQQFGEWLANQPADNTNGKIGAHGAVHIMAANPGQTMAYAQRYMAEQGVAPTNTVASSANSLRSNYDQEQSHQVHAVTKDSLNEVKEQTSDLKQNISQGTQVREKAEALQAAHNQAIKTESSGVLNHGAALKQEVHTEQDNGVVTRVAANGAQEVAQTAGNVLKSITGASLQSPGNSSINHYDKEEAYVHQRQDGHHQVQHAVTRDSVKPVNFEAGNMESRMDGQIIRNQVEGVMASNSTAIDAKTKQVQIQGDEVVNKVQKNQNKGVNYRMVAKGAKEIGNIAKNISNIKFGENQQK